MKISCASNLDISFIKKVCEGSLLKNTSIELFLSFPIYKFSLNRHLKPNISEYDFDSQIDLLIKKGFGVNYLLNSLSIDDYDKLKIVIQKLLNKGVKYFTISDPNVIKFVNTNFPDIKVVLSIIYGLKTSQQLDDLFSNYKIDRVIFDQSVNHDFQQLIKRIKICKKNGVETEILANELCYSECKYRRKHYTLDSNYNKNDFNLKAKLGDYCNEDRKSNNIILNSPWIRPEDIILYEKIGIDYIKIAGRNADTGVLYNCLYSYVNKSYEGNFFDLMDLDGKRDDNNGRDETRYFENSRLNGFIIKKIKNNE